jgi:hypothetical protein
MAAKKSTLAKTKTPGVYRRGKKYVYAYRIRGVAALEDRRHLRRSPPRQARRRASAANCAISRVSFGDYAREWIVNYQGRTSNGFRGSTRRAYTQMLEARIIPYFDGCGWPRSSPATSRPSSTG